MSFLEALKKMFTIHTEHTKPHAVVAVVPKSGKPAVQDLQSLLVTLLRFLPSIAFGSALVVALIMLAKRIIGKFPSIFRSKNKKFVFLNSYESELAEGLVKPEEITDSFDRVGGLAEEKADIHENLCFPFQHPELFDSDPHGIRQPPKGVLLYGPPGTGKTLLARAIAKECNANFICLRLDSLKSKWYGETEKIVAALFTLAQKIQPCIIFIDEIDALLGHRQKELHEVTSRLLSIFLSSWDGFFASKNSRVILIGATNYPDALDDAVLRRMPQRYFIGPPAAEARQQILQILLKNEALAEDVDLSEVAKLADSFTGSDLRELCRRAARYPVREYKDQLTRNSDTSQPMTSTTAVQQRPRPLQQTDFTQALASMRLEFPASNRLASSARGKSSGAAANPFRVRLD